MGASLPEWPGLVGDAGPLVFIPPCMQDRLNCGLESVIVGAGLFAHILSLRDDGSR